MDQDVLKISFWKRKPESVEEVQMVNLVKKGKYYCDGDKKYPDKVIKTLLDTLFNTLKINETEDAYKAQLFEDDKSNYQIKFFLAIHFANSTYLAIKGIQPFHQKNYKEIQDLFLPFFN